MSWFINPAINNGYPWRNEFPEEFRKDFYSDSNIKLPYSAWRISSGVNNDYPWLYWWFKKDTSTDTDGQMVIGGRQTNYPNGFSTNAGSSIIFDGNGQTFDNNPSLGSFMANNTYLYVCGPSGISFYLNKLKTFVSTASGAVLDKMAQLMGADLTSALILCKMYPFNIQSTGAPIGQLDLCCGLISFTSSDGDLPYYNISNTSVLLDFGYIVPNITQGWEIETIDWSIYLPYCGEFPIDLRSNEGIQLYCLVDLISGNCEYYLLLKKNAEHPGDIIFSTSGKMGTDVPVNLNLARLASNLQGWKNTLIGKGLELGGSALSMIPGISAVGGLAKTAGSFMEKITTHHTFTAPSLGGGVCFGAPEKARIIGRRPIIQNEAMGYPQLLGCNRKYMVDKVQEVGIGNYSEFENYKCDIIVATTEEKLEIERLMDSGVFV